MFYSHSINKLETYVDQLLTGFLSNTQNCEWCIFFPKQNYFLLDVCSVDDAVNGCLGSRRLKVRLASSYKVRKIDKQKDEQIKPVTISLFSGAKLNLESECTNNVKTRERTDKTYM